MDSHCVLVDVSELAPPEPLVIAMDAAVRLAPGQYLQIHHWREPLLLYERLARQSFGYDTRLGQDDSCEVFVWRLDDPSARQAAITAANQLPPWRD
jgi:hypothetical protein